MKVVLIDNGHGYDTSGKCSPDKSVKEYQYNRDIAIAVYDRLLNDPDIHPVLITPEINDISLAERVRRINKYVAKYGSSNCIMVSIHLNAAGNGQWMNARGWECYTTRKQNNSDKFADCLYEAAEQVLKGHKIRTDYSDKDKDKEADYYIIKNANCPSVLTENLFMDNKEDAAYLLSPEGFNNIVALHIKGIKLYFNKYK